MAAFLTQQSRHVVMLKPHSQAQRILDVSFEGQQQFYHVFLASYRCYAQRCMSAIICGINISFVGQ